MLVFFVLLFPLAASLKAVDYYVDAQLGSDANNGTSPASPWRSLAKVNAPFAGKGNSVGGFSPGDTINFRSGQIFSGSLVVNASGTASNVITYRSYDLNGSTPVFTEVPPATIQPPGVQVPIAGTNPVQYQLVDNADGVNIDSRNHVTLTNLRIVGRWNGTDATLINLNHHGISVTGSHTNLTLDDLQVSYFSARGMDIQNTASTPTQGLRITNCHITNTGLCAIRLRGSWRKINHESPYIAHCYTSYSMGYGPNGTVDNNYKPGGIEVSQARNALVEWSEAHHHGGGPSSVSSVGIWGWDCDRLVIQFCYSSNNKRSGQSFDGGGFDLDGGCINSVVQYSYSHDNDGPGQFICHFTNSDPTVNNVVRYNISINDAKNSSSQGALNFFGGASHGSVYNNLFVGGTATGDLVALEGGNAYTHVFNNIFVTTGTNNILDSANSTALTYRNNIWWSTTGRPKFLWAGTVRTGLDAFRAASNQEKLNGQNVGFEVDPGLRKADLTQPVSTITENGVTRAFTVYDLPQLFAHYSLLDGSPARDIGLNYGPYFPTLPAGYIPVSYPGLRDFFGNAVPQGNAYDVGPHENPNPAPPAPSAPDSFSASAIDSSVALAWSDVTDEVGYRLERTEDNGVTWTRVAMLAYNQTAYTDAGLATLTRYTYRLQAYNRSGGSSFLYASVSTNGTGQSTTAVADSYVNSGAANTNYGTSTTATIRTNTATQQAYLRFALPTTPLDQIGAVRVRVNVKASAAGETIAFGLYAVDTTTWIESGTGSITWNNAPVLGASLGSVDVNGTTSRWVEYDVTAHVETLRELGQTTASFALKANNNTTASVTLNTKENATNRPALETVPAIPPGADLDVQRIARIRHGNTDTVPGLPDGSPMTIAYTLRNVGDTALELPQGAVLSELANCSVTIATPPDSTLSAAPSLGYSYDSCPLVFDVTPSSAGGWSFRVTIPSNDTDQPAYTWLVSNPPALVAYYPLDGANSTTGVLETSGNVPALNATASGGPAWIETGGKVGGALSITSGYKYLTVPNHPRLDGTAKLSLSVWLYPTTSDTTTRCILTKRVAVNNAESFTLTSVNGNIRASFDGGETVLATVGTMTLNAWNHVVVVFDGTLPAAERVKIYLNGVLAATGTEPSSFIPLNESNAAIGFISSISGPFLGRMDELRIYRAALSADQVSQLNATPAQSPL